MASPKYWLLKSEPSTYSIDDLKAARKTLWDGVRNYQARNMLQEMKLGDQAFFYHSNCDQPAIVGLCKVVSEAKPDPTQFDKKSNYYDEKATRDKPRWFCPEVRFVAKFPAPVTRGDMGAEAKLKNLLVLKQGNRLSVTPVTKSEFETILRLANYSK